MSARPVSPGGREADSAGQRPSRGGRLYVWFAVLAGLTIFAGFARTLYLRSISDAHPPLSALLLVHGIVMTTWFVVFAVQVSLVAMRRTDLHRRLGVFGMMVALCVVGVGIAAVIDAGRRGSTPAPEVPPLEFMAISLFDMPVFALLVGAALWLRRRPDFHKRLMLLAVLSMLTPAIGRIPLPLIHDGGPPVFFGLALGIVLLAILVDTIRNRRLHSAFAWGAAFILAMLPLRLVVAQSAVWTNVANWLVRSTG